MKINYLLLNRPFITLKIMASLCSYCFIRNAGLQSRTTGISSPFARFYFQTISLPHLGNRNQSMSETLRCARV